jgi:PAP2 superfamily protein
MKHPAVPLRTMLGRPYKGAVEIAALFGLYAAYEVVRGFGSPSFDAARAHSDAIVSLERRLHVFAESGIQDWASSIPVLPGLLGLAYVILHVAATSAVLVWVYRSHHARFALVRTSLVVSTAISLVVYVAYPAAPPRLAGLGFADTVTEQAHVNLSSDVLGSFYNPFAAVPSLHFGYALLVGLVVARLARNRIVRAAGALYPAFMLFTIVATGNHFVFDAAAGGIVTAAGFMVARRLAAPRTSVRPPAAVASAPC